MTKTGRSDSLLFKGKNILVVEDEYFLADETRRELENLGANVVGPAADSSTALALIEDEAIDAAILDIMLEGESVFEVAERLEEMDIPYVFATSYDESIVPERLSQYVFCSKPFHLNMIAKALFRKG